MKIQLVQIKIAVRIAQSRTIIIFIFISYFSDASIIGEREKNNQNCIEKVRSKKVWLQFTLIVSPPPTLISLKPKSLILNEFYLSTHWYFKFDVMRFKRWWFICSPFLYDFNCFYYS